MGASRELNWGPAQKLNLVLLLRFLGLNWEFVDAWIGSQSRVELGPGLKKNGLVAAPPGVELGAGRGLNWGPGQGLNSVLLRRLLGFIWEPDEG